jgi:putative peptidoglycan lipid II flippase
MSFGKSLATVSGLTVISRIAGFLRDTLTAMFLGAGPEADAFFVAQRLPNLFRSLFAEGAFAAAFVPLYADEQNKRGDAAAQAFAGHALALLIGLLVPFSVLVIVAMPWVMRLLAPGFQDEPEKYAMAVSFSRITFPYLLLISITALQGGVLNARGSFGPAAAAPVCLNVVLIATLFLSHLFQWRVGHALAWGTTVSGVVQASWLAFSCWRRGVSLPLLWPHVTETTRRLFRQIGPGAVGAGAAQINLLLSTILASLLPTGAISYLFYADRLNQLPLGIVGIAVATTLLPVLARAVSMGDEKTIRHYSSRAIEFCLMLGLPATIGLSVAALPIIVTLFEHGAFTHADALATSEALAVYALGVPPFLLVKVFSARFFARQDTKTPVKCAIVAMGVNVMMALILLHPLQHVGMALATSLATWTNAGQLYFRLRQRGEHRGDARLAQKVPKIFLCAAGMAVITFLLTQATTDVFLQRDLKAQIVALALIIGASGGLYALFLQATGVVRFQDFIARKGA